MIKRLRGWLYQQRNPLKSAETYLKIAGLIMEEQGKCCGRIGDSIGRVDIHGALRMAVFGHIHFDGIDRVNRITNGRYWSRYREAQLLMIAHIRESMDPAVAEGLSDMEVLNRWNDTNFEQDVVRSFAEAAGKAR